MLEGRVFHSYILEPEKFAEQYAVLEEKIDRRTKEGKALWAEWVEAHPGKEAVDKPTATKLERMRQSILAHPSAAQALSDGVAEQSAFWLHTIGVDTPILCKGRFDYINPAGFIVDIKTTQDARAEAFSRSCWNYRYHVQDAYYLDGYKEITKIEPEGFLTIAIEKEPPYALEVYIANEEMVDQGRREYLADLRVYAECVRTGNWPAYSQDDKSIMLPVWAQDNR
jgi:exodeoxyribonuclease VIII